MGDINFGLGRRWGRAESPPGPATGSLPPLFGAAWSLGPPPQSFLVKSQRGDGGPVPEGLFCQMLVCLRD